MEITPKKLGANRKNAGCSTGPRSLQGKSRSSQNSFLHGLFSNRLHYDNEEEKANFIAIRTGLVEYYRPLGFMEVVLVDKIAALLWKQRTAFDILGERVEGYRNDGLVSKLTKFVDRAGLVEEKVPTRSGASDAGKTRLEVRELVLKVVRSSAETSKRAENRVGSGDAKLDASGDTNQDLTEVEARIAPSTDSLLRCYAMIERSLDRTITQLRELQAIRLG